MKKTLLFLVAASLLSGTSAIAQKIKLKEGNFDAVKGQREFNMRYDYSNMTVTTKKKPEAEFVSNKKEELNKKEAGTGDAWAESWVADRDKRFAGKFKEQFEKQSGLTIGDKPEAKYTLVFHTKHTETGYNIGISRRNAYIDGELLLVETANPDKVLARVSIDDAPGGMYGGFDFDTGGRLQESYAKAGKELGKFMKKKVK